MVKIRQASMEDDPAICVIAKQSPFTRDFTSHMFFRDHIEEAYANCEVGVAVERGKILGFVYVKHLKLKPRSVIHYMGVDSTCRQKGVGRKLLEWALSVSPHGYIELSCEHKNAAGMAFYKAAGLTELYQGEYGQKVKRPYTRWALE